MLIEENEKSRMNVQQWSIKILTMIIWYRDEHIFILVYLSLLVASSITELVRI